MNKLLWEELKNSLNGLVVWRAKVLGGWLVLADRGQGVSGLTFMPDKEHKWDVGTEGV